MNKTNDIIIEKTIINNVNDKESTIKLNYITPSITDNENYNLNESLPGVLFDRTHQNKELDNKIKGNNELDIKENTKENNQTEKIIERQKKIVPIQLVKAVDTRKLKKMGKEESEEDINLENKDSKVPSESLLEQEQMSGYDKFKFKVNNEKNVNLSRIGLGKVTRIEAVAFFTNLLIYPAIFFQVWQTYMTQEAEDIDIYFNTLQLFGGTPEGAVGVIIGYLIKSTQMIAIGMLAVVFRIFLTFYICFGKKGLIYDLFTRNK